MRINSALQREFNGQPTPKSDLYTIGDVPDVVLKAIRKSGNSAHRSWASRFIGCTQHSELQPGEIAFVFLASKVTPLEVQGFEDLNRLRNQYSIIFAVQLPCADRETLRQSGLPQSYYLLSLNGGSDIITDFSQRQMLLDFNRAHLALMSTFFDDGLICVDPMDFVYFCDGVGRINYHFVRAYNLEHANAQLREIAINLGGCVKNIFVCSDLIGVGSLEAFLDLACTLSLSNDMENMLMSSPTNIQVSSDVELHLFFGVSST